MTWQHQSDPENIALILASQRLTESQIRLVGVGCVRNLTHLLKDQRSQLALDLAEQYANGNYSTLDLQKAYIDANEVASYLDDGDDLEAYHAALAASWTVVDSEYSATAYAISHALYYAALAGGQKETLFQQQQYVVRFMTQSKHDGVK